VKLTSGRLLLLLLLGDAPGQACCGRSRLGISIAPGGGDGDGGAAVAVAAGSSDGR